MKKFKDCVNSLEDSFNELSQDIEERYRKVDEKEKSLEFEKKEMAKRYHLEDGIIELNVGGKHFSTYKSTLCKVEGSMLEAMFSGRHPLTKDSKGRIFVDRDPLPFEVILTYLRTGFWTNKTIDFNQLEIELDYYGLKDIYESSNSIFDDSNLLNISQQKQIIKWMGKRNSMKLIYRASQDGFGASNFHLKCDNKGPTLSVIKSQNDYIFGGFTSISWNSNGSYLIDSSAWIFSLVNQQKVPYQYIISNGSNSIYCNSSYGPTFGGGHDIYISDQSNSNNNSYSNPSSYKIPK